MKTFLISIIYLIRASVSSMSVPNVTYPTDTIIFQPRGIMFPTLNYGHIRTTINITAMQVAKDTICDLRAQAYFMTMGCQTSSSVFNKAMEITLRGLTFVKIYCDD